jgi:hypothetical protein
LVDNFASGSTPPASIDHNLYDSSAGTSGSQFLWLGKTYTGFAAWQAATGLDRHSLFANPQFADQAVFDFALTASSPAIGLGEVLGLAGTGLVDFVGDLRVSGTSIDAGAYEH